MDRSKLRQSKIEHFGVAQFGHKNICWLDVSVDFSLGVCCPASRTLRSARHFRTSTMQSTC